MKKKIVRCMRLWIDTHKIVKTPYPVLYLYILCAVLSPTFCKWKRTKQKKKKLHCNSPNFNNVQNISMFDLPFFFLFFFEPFLWLFPLWNFGYFIVIILFTRRTNMLSPFTHWINSFSVPIVVIATAASVAIPDITFTFASISIPIRWARTFVWWLVHWTKTKNRSIGNSELNSELNIYSFSTNVGYCSTHQFDHDSFDVLLSYHVYLNIYPFYNHFYRDPWIFEYN